MTQIYLQKLRRISIYGGALFVMLVSLIVGTPLRVAAAAPQDTYSWIKNIGTSGCNTPMFPGGTMIMDGKVYVADRQNSSIDVFDTNGNFISRFGSNGSGNGQFSFPRGIAHDAANNIYVVDVYNQRVEKFDSNGTYLSQFGSYGSGNGQFNYPYDIAIDATGNIYVTDSNNFRVQKFSSTGTYLSQFGSYGTTAGKFNTNIHAIAVDASGNVYVADKYRVQKFSSTGTYLSQFGSQGTGNGQFSDVPEAITIDAAGNIYVADASPNNRIEKFNSSGTYLSKFGSYGSNNGQLYNPSGIAIDASGNAYVADSFNQRMQKFDASGAYVLQFTYSPSSDPSSLCGPVSSQFGPDGNLYVLDSLYWSGSGWGNIKVYNPSTGAEVRTIGSTGQFSSATSMTVGPSGEIYVFDGDNSRVEILSPTGVVVGTFGSAGSDAGQFGYATDIMASPSGDVYVVDSDNDRVQRFSSTGTYLSQFGTTGTGNGQFSYPESMAIDDSGNVYVIDGRPWNTGVTRVQKFSSTGTYLSQFGSYGNNAGQFGEITRMTVDSAGNIYMADADNNRIEKFDKNGTYLSQFGSYGDANGQFASPLGVAVDDNGNVYVSDNGNHRISVWNAPIGPSAPQNVTVKPLSATMLKLSWTAPAHIGSSPLTAYRVLFRVVGTTSWITADTVSATTMEYTLSGLRPSTQYEVQIVALNAVGSSIDSGDVAGATAKAATFAPGQKTDNSELANTGTDMWLPMSAAGVAICLGAVLLVYFGKKRTT